MKGLKKLNGIMLLGLLCLTGCHKKKAPPKVLTSADKEMSQAGTLIGEELKLKKARQVTTGTHTTSSLMKVDEQAENLVISDSGIDSVDIKSTSTKKPEIVTPKAPEVDLAALSDQQTELNGLVLDEVGVVADRVQSRDLGRLAALTASYDLLHELAGSLITERKWIRVQQARLSVFVNAQAELDKTVATLNDKQQHDFQSLAIALKQFTKLYRDLDLYYESLQAYVEWLSLNQGVLKITDGHRSVANPQMEQMYREYVGQILHDFQEYQSSLGMAWKTILGVIDPARRRSDQNYEKAQEQAENARKYMAHLAQEEDERLRPSHDGLDNP